MKKTLFQFTLALYLLTLLLCCQQHKIKLTEKEKKNLVSFIDSIHLRNKAMSLLHEIPSTSIKEAFSSENINKIEKALRTMKRSIDESQKVNDQTLDKLYPDLSKHYRKEFCEGLKLYISFLEEGGVSKEKRSKYLSNKKWSRWFYRKFDSICKRSKWFLEEFSKRQDKILIPD